MNAGDPMAARTASKERSNVSVALVLAGVALAVFCTVIVNHLPS